MKKGRENKKECLKLNDRRTFVQADRGGEHKRRDSMMVVVLLHNVRCYSDSRVIELNLGRVQAATELASRSK